MDKVDWRKEMTMDKVDWGWLNTSQVLQVSSEIAEYFLMNHHNVSSEELYYTNESGDLEGLREEYFDEFAVIYDDMDNLIRKTVEVKE